MVHVKMVNKERSVADLDIWIFSHGSFCDVAYNSHKHYWIFASHQFTKDRQIELWKKTMCMQQQQQQQQQQQKQFYREFAV